MGYRVSAVDPARTALIVVDVQNDFVAPGAPLESAAGYAMLPTLGALIDFCRKAGILVVYTAHVHRPDGSDMGRYKDLYPPIADGSALVDGTPGGDIHPAVAPAPGEIVVKKHRYSGFFGTDLEILLRGRGITTVAVTGVTTEDCVHATARDAMFRDFWTLVVADACGTYDHPDLGWGAMTADEVHRAALVVLAQSTADVVTAEQFTARVG
ncbi:cysteine hydrolase [Streptomyces sp. SID3343]|uniref:cysteine hydrolase family protein n=1 Tax=Streptomyces sp. SID3343 TaxID=2690260 RepID=UPI0013686766|nr:cysteine hydrolase [Streptomyces sp. SID3343]MYW04306.1 isochorismatase family protein [Streptomyces sp. SID3343]